MSIELPSSTSTPQQAAATTAYLIGVADAAAENEYMLAVPAVQPAETRPWWLCGMRLPTSLPSHVQSVTLDTDRCCTIVEVTPHVGS